MKMICPFCGLKGTAKDTLLGKKVRCPECQKVFVVSEEVAVVTSEVLAASQQAGEAVAAEQDMPASAGNSQMTAAPPVPPEMPLAEGVVRCSKCGFALNERFVQQQGSDKLCLVCAG